MKGKKEEEKKTERWKKTRHEVRGLSEMKSEEKTIVMLTHINCKSFRLQAE